MSASHVKLVMGETATGAQLEIDGVNVARAVRGLTIDAQVGEANQITLRLVMVGTEVDGQARLYLPGATVGLLARFGWQPPPDAHINSDGGVLLVKAVESEASPPADHPA